MKRWMHICVGTLLMITCGACGSSKIERPSGPLADAQTACNLNRPGASELTASSLSVPLPRRKPDYAGIAAALSCLSKRLGGPVDFGQRVMFGENSKGNYKLGAYSATWDLHGRSNGSGDLHISVP